MLRTISLNSSGENSRELIRRRRRFHHQNSKIKPKVNENTFSTTVTSFGPCKTNRQKEISSDETYNRSDELILPTNKSLRPVNNNDTDKHLKQAIQLKKYNQLFKYVSRILYGLLAVLFLAALVVPSVLVSLLTPKSQAQTRLTQLTVHTNHCGGISPYTRWQINDTITVTMIINTTQCNFPKTPLYFVNILGRGSHFCLFGYSAIYVPTKESFQIYTRYACSSIVTSTTVLSLTQSNMYDISWAGFYK